MVGAHFQDVFVLFPTVKNHENHIFSKSHEETSPWDHAPAKERKKYVPDSLNDSSVRPNGTPVIQVLRSGKTVINIFV